MWRWAKLDTKRTASKEKNMIGRKWLWAGLLAVPLVVGGGLAVAASQVDSITCPFTGKVISLHFSCPFSSSCCQETEQPSASPTAIEERACESCSPEVE